MLHLLGDVDARLAGMWIADALLARPAPRTVRLRLPLSLRQAIFSLPTIDAATQRFRSARISLSGTETVLALLSAHLQQSLGIRIAPESDGTDCDLEIDLTENDLTRAVLDDQVLRVPSLPHPAREQHASAHAGDGARLAGLEVKGHAPALSLAPDKMAEARARVRGLAGILGGPLVAVSPDEGGWGTDKFAALATLLKKKMGAVLIQLGGPPVPGVTPVFNWTPEVRAAALSLSAVCVGDDTGWTHVAAAAGAPVVTVHGDTCPTRFGPATPRGVAAFNARGTCNLCIQSKAEKKTRRCLDCLDPARVAGLAETLAAARWPWDVVERYLTE